MNTCFYGERNRDFEDIVEYWNKKPMIKKFIGKIGGTKAEDMMADVYLNDVAEHLFRIPFNSEFKYTKGMFNRMKREIDNIESNYKSGKLGVFRKYFYVPDAIANKSPVTRMFYENVNMAINYERNNMDEFLSYSKGIAKHVRNALITETGMSKREVKKFQRKMQDAETKILRADSESDRSKYYREYSKLFDSHGGKVVGDYIKLMEMDKATFQKESGKYSKDIVLAATDSRTLLNSMGKVMINGLSRMENVVKLLYSNPVLPKKGQNYIDRIRESKKMIETGIEQGGYLPHYALDSIVEMNYKMRTLMETKNATSREEAIGGLLSKLETMIPNQAQGRNETLNKIWAKNPFYILNQYSKDVIAFNKINFIQENYIPAMRRMQKEDVSTEFVRDMRNFIEDTFQVSTKGMLQRPDWVNATVRSLMAVETLKSMGLSVTGALRNGASAAYFFTQNGVLSATRAVSKYHSHYEAPLAKIEKEQGFKFAEAGRELVAEGLIPSEGVNVSDIKYDPIKNSITYRDRGILKKLDPLTDTAVGKSLVFHRFTENATRRWMFRIAWVQAFETLNGKNIVAPGEVIKPDRNTAALERMATKFALKAVNTFAFEYAAHAKARAIGGTAPHSLELTSDGRPKMKSRDYASALGELGFQFMHYPMSFLNLQSKIAKGAKDAFLSGQYDAPEIKQALRFAGIYSAVQALSITTNLDLTNTLENDTVERLMNLKDYFIGDEEDLENKRGLVNDFTGPIVGDMLYALNMFQLYKMPDSEWGKMLTGYTDFYEEGDVPSWVNPKKQLDSNEKRNMWNRLNVEFARWKTKIVPAIRDGRGMDILRAELGWYPRKEQKRSRKKVNELSNKYLGFKPFDSGKKKKRGKTEAERALQKLMKDVYGV